MTQCYAQLFLGFLLQGILCDGLECLLNVDGLLGRRLEIWDVAFGLTPSHRALLCHLNHWT